MANEYKIETAHDSSSLAKKVNELIKEGWQTVGSHQVVIKHQQLRYAGMQHKDTIFEIEYSQTLVNSERVF